MVWLGRTRGFGELGLDPLDDGLGQKGGDVAAHAGNLLDQAAG